MAGFRWQNEMGVACERSRGISSVDIRHAYAQALSLCSAIPVSALVPDQSDATVHQCP
jgi:hypothetical protein